MQEKEDTERGDNYDFTEMKEGREGGSEENSVTRDAAKEVLSCQYLAGSPIEINLSKELIPAIYGPLI